MNDRIPGRAAGYMELYAASKDGDCGKVRVPSGISRTLGCCNLFQPQSTFTKEFRCGTCQYVRAESQKAMEKYLIKS